MNPKRDEQKRPETKRQQGNEPPSEIINAEEEDDEQQQRRRRQTPPSRSTCVRVGENPASDDLAVASEVVFEIFHGPLFGYAADVEISELNRVRRRTSKGDLGEDERSPTNDDARRTLIVLFCRRRPFMVFTALSASSVRTKLTKP